MLPIAYIIKTEIKKIYQSSDFISYYFIHPSTTGSLLQNILRSILAESLTNKQITINDSLNAAELSIPRK